MDKLLEKHVVARFISLVLAFFLWLSVVNEQNPEIDRPVMVQPQLRGMPTDLVLIEEIEPVSIRLRGRRNDIFEIRADELEVYTSLSGAKEGENVLEVQLGRLPAGIKAVEIIPAHIVVQTEGIIQEQREIQLSLKGEPAEGHVLGEKLLAPTQVMVEGPRSWVEQIARVVARLDITEAVNDVQEVVLLQALNRQGGVLNEEVIIRPEVVEIKLPVEELPSKVLPIRPHIIGQLAEGYQIEEVITIPAEVKVYAAQEVLDQIFQIETAPIDIEGAIANTVSEPRLLIPDGIQLPIGRGRVTVVVSERTVEKRVREIPLKISNLGEGLAAEADPQTVEVTVTGFSNHINSLQARDISAIVDTSHLEVGQHRLKVRLELPPGVQKVAVNPEEVTVSITEAPGE